MFHDNEHVSLKPDEEVSLVQWKQKLWFVYYKVEVIRTGTLFRIKFFYKIYFHRSISSLLS